MTKFNKAAAVSAVALVIPLLMAAPAFAGDNDEGKGKFSQDQQVGYLGELSKSQVARDVLDRIKNQREARKVSGSADRVLMWNEVALDSNALDHTPDPSTGKASLSQGGPVRTARAFAMTQIAVFDAVNAFSGKFRAYDNIGRAPRGASLDAAICYAAHDVLVALYPTQKARIDLILASDLSKVADSAQSVAAGKAVGQASAAAILARRTGDGSQISEVQFGSGGRVASGTMTYFGQPVNNGNGLALNWSPDPLTPGANPGTINMLALGANWGAVTPFVLARGDQFRAPPPPMPGSAAYRAGWNEVKDVGASSDTAGSTATAATKFIGNYWGYDGAPLLGTPPRLYTQIAMQLAKDNGITRVNELARYLAMVATAMGDAGIAAWDSKYYYNYWRPVTGIRRGTEDGDAQTAADANWKPVGISVINTTNPILATPPFPAYVSGHATFGAAIFEVIRGFIPNNTRFTFVSDEYNGTGVDPFGTPRPLVPVRFRSLQQAQEENGQSRVYNGVHWIWDSTAGQNIGVSIGQYLPNHAFQRIRDERDDD
ncbi:MAG: phosphatase PAP2 family protein [Sphingomonas sp.]|nr:phosphatase PAP2 family protein [Sphingomonas sp.]